MVSDMSSHDKYYDDDDDEYDDADDNAYQGCH